MSTPQPSPVTGSSQSALTAATLGFFFGFAAVALFGPTAKDIKDILGLSAGEVGLLVAAPSLSGSLLRIPFSAWVDTTGGRKPFQVLLGISLVGMAGLVALVNVFYPDDLTMGVYWAMVGFGVLAGAGIATFSVGISQVSYWFPQARQGWALGTYAGAGNLAPGLFSFLLPVALDAWGLPVAYILWLGLLGLGAFLYWNLAANAPYFQLRAAGVDDEASRVAAGSMGQQLFPAGSVRETLRKSAANWKTWALVVLYFSSFGGFIALTAWLPTYWQELHGRSLFAAGALTATFSLLASAIRIPGGSVSDRFGGEQTAVAAFAVMLVGAALMTISQELWLSLVGEIAMGSGMGVANAAVFKLVPKEVPEAIGGAVGWVGGLGAFGGFAIPPLMGLFVTETTLTGYARGFSVFVVLGAVSLAVVGFLRRRETSLRSEARMPAR